MNAHTYSFIHAIPPVHPFSIKLTRVIPRAHPRCSNVPLVLPPWPRISRSSVAKNESQTAHNWPRLLSHLIRPIVIYLAATSAADHAQNEELLSEIEPVFYLRKIQVFIACALNTRCPFEAE